MNEIHPSIVALGTFDGVHLGHQQIIRYLLDIANQKNLKPIIVTFFPHPSHVLTPEKPLKLINSIEERVQLIRVNGVESIYVQEFTKAFSEQTARDFVINVLLNELHIKILIVGHDHSFGKNKEGNFELLQQLGNEFGFEVIQVPPLYKENVLISSTLIRQNIENGNFEAVNPYLGYPFCLFGKVVQGNQLGRKIGYNTANIILDYSNKIIPKKGVYVVQTNIDEHAYYGMMNIGNRPTVDGKTETIEVHLFDLNQDLYYQKLRVKVLHRLRDEFKFESIEALRNQLDQDQKNALIWIKQTTKTN
ncbi:MAG: bifunctional riboflavin kinase/FAD synthetase [Flavobacteriaceae bacterium]|nr:bifunctional riboflavin kinase/FAD synthetase [Flavobacteriaceae bacterium]